MINQYFGMVVTSSVHQFSKEEFLGLDDMHFSTGIFTPDQICRMCGITQNLLQPAQQRQVKRYLQQSQTESPAAVTAKIVRDAETYSDMQTLYTAALFYERCENKSLRPWTLMEMLTAISECRTKSQGKAFVAPATVFDAKAGCDGTPFIVGVGEYQGTIQLLWDVFDTEHRLYERCFGLVENGVCPLGDAEWKETKRQLGFT